MKKSYILIVSLLVFKFVIDPVSASATAEAREILHYLSGLKGKAILIGQQNMAPDVMKYTNEVYNITGKYPAILGKDFSYGDETRERRLKIVHAAVEQWRNGGLVTILWHLVNPDTRDGSVSEGFFLEIQEPNDINRVKSPSKNGIISFAKLCWWTHITKHNSKEEIIQVYNHRHSITRDKVNWKSEWHKLLKYILPNSTLTDLKKKHIFN